MQTNANVDAIDPPRLTLVLRFYQDGATVSKQFRSTESVESNARPLEEHELVLIQSLPEVYG